MTRFMLFLMAKQAYYPRKDIIELFDGDLL